MLKRIALTLALLGVLLTGPILFGAFQETAAAPLPDAAWLANRHGLQLTLPNGRTATFTVEREVPAPGMLALHGVSADEDRLVLFSAGSFADGHLWTRDGRYRLVVLDGAVRWVPAGEGRTAFAPEEVSPGLSKASTEIAPVPAKADRFVVDLLILADDSFHSVYANPEAKARSLVHLANTFLANSAVPVRLNVVGIRRMTLQISSVNDMPANAEVRSLRDAHGADLVTYLTGGGACSGFAHAFNGGHDTPDGEAPRFVNPDHAFSAVNQGPFCREDTLAHELGHNLGAGHDFAAGATLEWREYAHGWDCGDAGAQWKYASVMHYGYVVLEARGDFFSSPQVFRHGERCGSDGMVEPLRADNARAIAEAAPYVVNYRASAAGGSGGGSLPLAILVPLLLLAACRRRLDIFSRR